MDALRLFRGFLLTTWLVWTLTILLLNVDLAKCWISTASLYLTDPCTKIWPVVKQVAFFIFINMNASKCCVLSCKNTRPDYTLHMFPNPEKELDRFNRWVYAIGGNVLVMDPMSIFKNGRICHIHFDTKYYTASRRLSRDAIPSLHLSCSILQRLPLQNVTNQKNYPTQIIEPVMHAVVQPQYSGPSTSQHHVPSVSEQGRNKKTIFKSFDADAIVLRNKIKRLQGQKDSAVTQLKKALKLAENRTFQKAIGKFSATANIFTMLQFREAGKRKMGYRFTKDEKIMSLALYKQGPRAYRWLRKFFVLPSPLTLSRIIARASLHPGINERLFYQLEKRVKKMKPTEKLCTLLFDEVALTAHFDYNRRKDFITGFVNNGTIIEDKIADHALVFMVRGIQKNYKQPVAYTFCAGTTPTHDLTKQIKDIIKKLKSIGMTIIATVCDQGATNVSAINWLIRATKEKYIREGNILKNNVFEVDGDEIIPLYDPPHLIKGIRNNLLNKNLKFKMDGQEKIAKWDHIVQLYQQNPAYRGIRLMPKLTERHVVPHKISKMKVKCATQVFSQSVAANMGYLSSMGILPKECEETADLLIFFDNLFDSVNGSYNNNKKRPGKPLLGPVKPNSLHKKVWAEAKNVIHSMKYCTEIKSGVVPSITNWLHTIENIEYMIDVLSKRHNLTSVWMRHFNQDPLENFFGCIRSHGYRNTSPTCAGFEAAYASLLINNLSTHSPGSNCEEDRCTNFKSLQELFFKDPETLSYVTNVDYEDVNIDNIFIDLEQKVQDPKIKAQLEYVAGYVLKKLKVKCKDCTISLYNNENKGDCAISFREYVKNKSCLTYPSTSLIKCFSQLQDVVINIIRKDSKKKNIKEYIKTIFSIVIDYNFIKCDMHKREIISKMEEICINIFICNWCKDTNKILCGSRQDYDEYDKIQTLSRNYNKKRSK